MFLISFNCEFKDQFFPLFFTIEIIDRNAGSLVGSLFLARRCSLIRDSRLPLHPGETFARSLKCKRIIWKQVIRLTLRCVWFQCVSVFVLLQVWVFSFPSYTHISHLEWPGGSLSPHPEDLSADLSWQHTVGLQELSPLLVEKKGCYWNILTLFWILIPCLVLWLVVFFFNDFTMNNTFDLFFSV